MNDKKKIRQFGVVLAIILFLIGTINLYRKNIGPAVLFYVLDLSVAALVVVNPVLLSPVYKCLMFVSRAIGWVNTRLLLGLIYYLVFTPIGIVFRILRKDPLGRRFNREKESYWILRNKEFDPSRCERQF